MRWLLASDRAAALPLGGMTVVLTETGRRLAAAGDEVHWVTGSLNESLPERGRWEGVEVHSFLLAGSMGLTALLRSHRQLRSRIRRIFKEGFIDAAIIHQPFAGLAAGSELKHRGIPSCYFFHSPWAEEFRLNADPPRAANSPGASLRRSLEARALTAFDKIAVFSDSMAAHLRREHPRVPEPHRVTPGVDLDRFRPVEDRSSARRALGWPEEGPVVFALRRLVQRTGVDLLIEAFPRVVSRHPGATLLIGGRGPLYDELCTLARRLGLTHRIRFLGYIPAEDLPAALGAADVVAIPTRALEGLGLVTLEAFAVATPVVVTPVGANPELLDPVDPTLVAARADADALGACLAELLDRSEEALASLGRKCREHAEANFGWDRTVADLRRIVEIGR